MDKKVLIGGAGALAAVGALIVGVATRENEVIVPGVVKMICKNKDIEKEYDTADGSAVKIGESTKMISLNGVPFYFDGDCSIKK